MPITRRQFIKRTGAITAGTLLGPNLWSNAFVRQAMATQLANKYFVVIFLDGGNDGLNTVIPVDEGGDTLRTAYEAARNTGGGGLRITPAQLGATLIGTDPGSGAQLALHPGFVNGMKVLYDAGKVAVIQGCGYPSYSLSHDESRNIWRTANPAGLPAYGANGWVGRYFGAPGNYGPTNIPGLTVSDSVAGEFRTTATSVLAVQRLRDFGFPYDEDYSFDDTAKHDGFNSLCLAATSNAQSTLSYLGASGKATLDASEAYPPLHSYYNNASRGFDPGQYDILDTSTARNLREVAKVIYGVEQGIPNVGGRVFELSNGGYDTHSDQGAAELDGRQYGLHREVGDALKLFYDDLADMGVASKVTVLVWSEFSRRVEQNGSGTDHGSQGPMFVIGGSVVGGVYGKHPNINASALDAYGNTPYRQGPPATAFRSTDFRDVYGTLLKHWMGVTPAEITASVLPLDAGDPNLYWTAPQFDLGFLA